MSNYFRKKIIMNVWTILIVLSSFNFCLRVLFHIKKKNNENIYKNRKSSNDGTLNFSSQNKNILLQIGILKNTMFMNNSIFQNHNKIFSHNITYHKNVISKKITAANITIKHEINILNKMINIIDNHPYNYLKFFQVNHYTIPNISTRNNNKIHTKLSDIKSYSSKLNKKSTNINSIFYKSEENIVGFRSNVSVISSLKLLLVQKINFKYCNILYFSNNLNSLSTLDKYHENNGYNDDNHLITNNKLLNNNKVSLKSKFISNNGEAKYLKNKPYMYMTPIFIIGLIGVIIMVGGNRRRLARQIKARRRFPKNFSRGREINLLVSIPKENTSSTIEQSTADDKNDSDEIESNVHLTKTTEVIETNTQDSWSSISLSDWPDNTVDQILNSLYFPRDQICKITSGMSEHTTMDIDTYHDSQKPELDMLIPTHIQDIISHQQQENIELPFTHGDNASLRPSNYNHGGISYKNDGDNLQSQQYLTDEISPTDVVDIQHSPNPIFFTNLPNTSTNNVTKYTYSQVSPTDVMLKRNEETAIDIDSPYNIVGASSSSELFSRPIENTISTYLQFEKKELTLLPKCNSSLSCNDSIEKALNNGNSITRYRDSISGYIRSAIHAVTHKTRPKYRINPRRSKYTISYSKSKINVKPENNKRIVHAIERSNWKEETMGLRIRKAQYFYTIEDSKIPPNIPVFILHENGPKLEIVQFIHTHPEEVSHPTKFTEKDQHFSNHSKKKIESVVTWWMDQDIKKQKSISDKLYCMRELHQPCTQSDFELQVYGYFYKQELSIKEQWLRPNSYHILSNIWESLDSAKNHNLTYDEKYIALAYLKNIAKFEATRKYSSEPLYTTHGWFQHPLIHHYRVINKKTITNKDYEYLQGQNKKFNNMESLLPKSYGDLEYYKLLLEEIKTGKVESKISQLDKFIANEIINDLREIIVSYKSFINISEIKKDELPVYLKKRHKFPDYTWKFNNTRLVRSNFDGISHNGVSEDVLLELLFHL